MRMTRGTLAPVFLLIRSAAVALYGFALGGVAPCGVTLCGVAPWSAALCRAEDPQPPEKVIAGEVVPRNGQRTELMLPPAAELPNQASASVVLDGPGKDLIDRALQGKAVTQPGNEVLSDVIQVIRKRGSILDGSSLDPENTNQTAQGTAQGTAQEMAQEMAKHSDAGSPITDSKLRPYSHAKRPASPGDRRAFAAEQLLRTARLLSQLDDAEQSRTLIKDMRDRAIKLLTKPSQLE